VPETTRLHHEPVAVFSVTLDDEPHTDDVAPVEARRRHRLSAWLAPFQPTTVTLCDPVMAALAAFTLLNAGPSNVRVAVNDRSCWSLVIDKRTPADTPLAVLHRTAESDNHAVEVISLPPRRVRTLLATAL
jgi:hypothetical protein